MIDVLGIGCTAVDDVLYIDTYPVADSKMRIKRSERRFGGLTQMALVAAAKLGGRCAFAGLLGEDELSKSVEENLVRHGIDVSAAIRHKDSRPVHAVIIAAEATGTRNIFFDASAPIGADPSGPSEAIIRSSKVLFLDNMGVEGGIRAARIARGAGIPVVADLEDDRDARFEELIDLVDHLVIGDDFATHLTGIADPGDSARHLGDLDTVVVTRGADGAWFASGGRVGHRPAFPVAAVDTTGCGDVFHGAYALALARGEDLESRIRFASAAAAVKATQSEAPAAEQVQRMLEENFRP